MKTIEFIVALLLPLSSLIAADPDFKDEIAALQMCEMSGASGIQLWDGSPVASYHDIHGRLHGWTFSAAHLSPSLLAVTGVEELSSIGTCDGMPVALGTMASRTVLMRKDSSGQWRSLTVPGGMKAKSSIIIPSASGIAILGNGYAYRFVNGKWATTTLPRRPKALSYLGDQGSARILYGSRLFIGWDQGEWGGALAVCDLNKPEKGWSEITRRYFRDFMVSGVCGMLEDRQNLLWVAQGCCHRSINARGLHTYDGNKWTEVVDGESEEDRGPVRFPGVNTDITGITLGPDGKLYVVAGSLGVFLYENRAMHPVVSCNFYSISKDIPGKHVSYGCYPRGLVIDKDENIFVSTAYFGILCFLRSDGTYHLKQVLLPE